MQSKENVNKYRVHNNEVSTTLCKQQVKGAHNGDVGDES